MFMQYPLGCIKSFYSIKKKKNPLGVGERQRLDNRYKKFEGFLVDKVTTIDL
jgi:hypothetical protein